MKESTKRHKALKKRRLRNNEYYDTQHIFDELYSQAKDNKIFTDLMSIISSEQNILLAYRNIKKNTGSKTRGADNTTINDYHIVDTEQFVKRIKNKLNNYKPGKVRRVEIPKDNGKTRPLGIPTMEDRLIQQTIKQVLEPICEAKFHPNSYGFRPNRGTSHAMAKVGRYINMNKLHYCVDIDIKGFFDNVNHGKLLKQMWTLGIRDKNLLCIISKILKSEIEGIGVPNKGTPQGGIISPLLSNIVLNELDWWVGSQWEQFETKHDYSIKRVKDGKEYIQNSGKYRALKKSSNLKEVYLVRYADDFKIFCRDYETAGKMFIATKNWLEERLGLEISNEKSKITNLRKNRTEFLGFALKVKQKGKKLVWKSNISEKAKKKIIKNLKDQIKVIQKNTITDQVVKLNSIIRGSHNYYRMATHCVHDFDEVNFHIHRTLKRRLRTHITHEDCRTEYYKRSYKGYNNKLITIAKMTVYPIFACRTKHPLSFDQSINNYTEEGRRAIHENLKGYHHLVEYLNKVKPGHTPIERYDNSISLMVAQNGLCGVTKRQLIADNMELHHKVPLSMKGTDKYDNLIWISKEIHKLIHATKEETINKYKKYLTDKTSLKKLNNLRVLVGNPIITM